MLLVVLAAVLAAARAGIEILDYDPVANPAAGLRWNLPQLRPVS